MLFICIYNINILHYSYSYDLGALIGPAYMFIREMVHLLSDST